MARGTGEDRVRDDDWTDVSSQPVVPFGMFGFDNVLRRTVPYHVDRRGQDGIGDVSDFDLVLVPEDRGRGGSARS